MATINFPQELAKLKKPVWQEIQKYLPNKSPHGHYTMISEYPSRQGKYFRPGLVLLATEIFGGDQKRATLTAAAMQVSEDWLLIHDDAEDHSLKRRGKPTLNELYGYELAVNAGDALHMIMWKVLGDAAEKLNKETGSPRSIPPRREQRGKQIFNTMNDILLKATEGQYLELNWIRNGSVFVSQKEYLDMIKRKTAYYTIIGPLKLGAIIAGVPQKDINNIEKWGVPFGYAFQIWDDCMNLNTSDRKQGKEQAGDIWEGKRTLILSHLLQNCSGSEKKQIEKIYLKDRAKKSEQDIRYILRLMNNYGSITYAQNVARKFSERAGKLFDKHTAHLKDTKAKHIIRAGIDFVTHRSH